MADPKKVEHPQVVNECYTDLTPIDKRIKGIKNGVTTNLTIVFDDPKATQAFAVRGATIAWQQRCHQAGTVPKEETVLISELAKRNVGFKATPESIANKVRKMPEAEYRETLANLGLPKAEIDKLAREHYPPVK
jgi:hypothetical protein